ncbi:MAG TPA: methylated-DNA--[protein]-cysteine S-methyltransferase [Acidobacteriota bacterium]|jgi:methylated-DNA-[protein]-cysteine S-methyltransferase|nr:methylated-DNA--[protein]-cysteine S-methyltransferase [Acidobacteriota bacterium]
MSEEIRYSNFRSPIGALLIAENNAGVIAIHFPNGKERIEPSWKQVDHLQSGITEQLDEYFRGERFDFDVPLVPQGTPFQLRVWNALQKIPYGETISYLDLAKRIGSPQAVRAVGAANGANPLPIVIPCHRVIGHNGKLVGYGGGLEIKKHLLSMESLYCGLK